MSRTRQHGKNKLITPCMQTTEEQITPLHETRSTAVPPWMGCSSTTGSAPTTSSQYPFILLGEEQNVLSKETTK